MPTTRSGNVEILEIDGKKITVKFLLTGNDKVTSKDSLKCGSVLDKLALQQRARQKAAAKEPPCQFKDIPGFPGYLASEAGEVWSRRLGGTLKSSVNGDGYCRVKVLGVDKSVQHLIASTFVPNPEGKPMVQHINGDRSDNRAENLRWFTQDERYADARVTAGERFQSNLYGEVEVVDYRESKNILIRFVNTGNEYSVQIQNLRAGEVQDKIERARVAAERMAEKAAKANEHHERMAEFEHARKAAVSAKAAIEAAKKVLKSHRLVGQEFTDNLGMEFRVVAPAEDGKTWIVKYRKSGNVYTFKEGWMLKGRCYDRHSKEFAEKYEALTKQRAIEWYEDNREAAISRASKYQRVHKDKTCTRNRNRHARRKGAEGSHTHEEVTMLLIRQEYKCACCSESLEHEKHLDHIMPLARGGSNWIDNLQWLCPFCNMSKSDRHPDDWEAYRTTPQFLTRKEARKILEDENSNPTNGQSANFVPCYTSFIESTEQE